MQQHLTVRLPQDLLARVEAYRQRLEKTTGLTVNRADTLRVLIAAGLDAKTKEDGQ